MNIRALWIVGPTAVGKTAVAITLAQRLGAEIVSADSMQVYRGMDIGTVKPTPAERAVVPHHLIDVCAVNEPFDVKRFVVLARQAMDDIRRRGRLPMVVGGTGLYVRALRHGLFDRPSRDPGLRARLEGMRAEALFEELQRMDPATARGIDRHNPRRLVRALEVLYTTGKPIRALQTQWGREGTVADEPLYGLTRVREDLYERIEQRIDHQLARGWLDEVAHLMQHGIEANRTALQAAGYRELVAHLKGACTLADAVTRIKARTRQLARRQLTWFRREPDLVWVEIGRNDPPQHTAEMLCRMKETTNKR